MLSNDQSLQTMKLFFRTIQSSVSQAWGQLIGNKMRTSLSLLGVAIGIFCIIAILSAVNSLQTNVNTSLSKLGDKTVYVQKFKWGEMLSPEERLEQNKWPNPSYQEFLQLNKDLGSDGDAAYYAFQRSKTLKWKNSSVNNTFLMASSQNFDKLFGLEFYDGRFFTSQELTQGYSVCILGKVVAEELFGAIEPVGKFVKLMGQKLLVVGVIEKSGDDILKILDFDEVVLVSPKYMDKIFNMDSPFFFSSIVAAPSNNSTLQNLKDQITLSIRADRKLSPKSKSNFSMNNLSMISNMLVQIFAQLQGVGIIIGIFSIFVGGFSVANIMFVSVKERTNLIGIKMALGAKRIVILTEFLIESVVLCVIGGLIGILLVLGVIAIINASGSFEMTLTTNHFITGILLSSFIGIFAGLTPAYNASKLDPVTAIRG